MRPPKWIEEITLWIGFFTSAWGGYVWIENQPLWWVGLIVGILVTFFGQIVIKKAIRYAKAAELAEAKSIIGTSSKFLTYAWEERHKQNPDLMLTIRIWISTRQVKWAEALWSSESEVCDDTIFEIARVMRQIPEDSVQHALRESFQSAKNMAVEWCVRHGHSF